MDLNERENGEAKKSCKEKWAEEAEVMASFGRPKGVESEAHENYCRQCCSF